MANNNDRRQNTTLASPDTGGFFVHADGFDGLPVSQQMSSFGKKKTLLLLTNVSYSVVTAAVLWAAASRAVEPL
jgi:hypothetical protein